MQKARSEKGEVFLKPRAFKTGQRRALQRAKRLEKRRAEPLQRQRDAQGRRLLPRAAGSSQLAAKIPDSVSRQSASRSLAAAQVQQQVK